MALPLPTPPKNYSMSNSNEQKYYGNIIHPTAIIYDGVIMGVGNYIGPYCIIGAPPEYNGNIQHFGKVVIGNGNRFTGLVTIDSGSDSPTVIKDSNWFLKHSHIGHDVQMGSNNTLSCGAKIGGHTVIGDCNNIGLNAVVHQKQIIPDWVMLGMAAVITKKHDLQINRKYAGNPAKDIGPNIMPENWKK